MFTCSARFDDQPVESAFRGRFSFEKIDFGADDQPRGSPPWIAHSWSTLYSYS